MRWWLVYSETESRVCCSSCPMMGYTVDQAPPPDLSALTFTPPKTLRCIVSRWWIVRLRALFLCLHFSVFSSSPSALIIPPTRKCCSGGLSVAPSQKHKSSFIAFYRLLHHRKCRVECAENGDRVSFLFFLSIIRKQQLCSLSPPAGWGVHWQVFFFVQFKFGQNVLSLTLSHNFMEVRTALFRKRKFNITSQSMLFRQTS